MLTIHILNWDRSFALILKRETLSEVSYAFSFDMNVFERFFIWGGGGAAGDSNILIKS